MKKLSYLCLVLFTILLVQSCQEDDTDTPEVNGKVVFSFDTTTSSNKSSALKNLTTEKSVEDAVAILISVEDAGGVSVYEQKRIDLININGQYLTSPVSLSPGSYSITEFIVVDALSNAIYLTPKEGSEYASYVNDPLPVSFTVSPDLVENVNLEVVGTENATPEDFGYASFNFTVVGDGTFGVSASIYNPETLGFELTEATMVLKGDGTELLTKILGAEVNYYLILGDYNTYTIEISKEGFTTISKDFSAEEINELADAPYNAVLSNSNGSDSFTFITDQTTQLDEIYVTLLSASEDEYLVDWGDGSTDLHSTSSVSHVYSEHGIYTVTVTGNIKVLEFLLTFNALLIDIDLSKLESLNTLHLSSSKLTSLDLSSNLLLEYCRIFGSNNELTSIDLSSNVHLKELALLDTQLSSIDLSNNLELTQLSLSATLLNTIDLSNNLELENLSLSNNPYINSLDISSHTKLRYLTLNFMSQLNFDNLDLSLYPELINLRLNGNELTSIDVSNNIKLQSLSLWDNQLTNINLSANTELRQISLEENQLTNIDLSSNPGLTSVGLFNNQLSTLDISNNFNLAYLNIGNNQINAVADMELIYNQLLLNVSANNIVDGMLYSVDNVVPSQVIIDIANELTNDYNWSVSY